MRTPAADAYRRLEQEREPYLDRARDVSSVTIPFLVPPEGIHGATNLPTPYQGIGAEGVNNLASKLILALFPPSAAFFRLVVDPAAVRDLAEEQGEDETTIVQEVDEDVAVVEREIHAEFESRGMRPALYETFRHLIVAGNVLLRWDGPELRVFTLPQFVIKRSGSGTIEWVVTRESVSRDTLPEGVRATAEGDPQNQGSAWLYTAAHRQPDGRYRVWQEAGEAILKPDTVDEADLPYVAPRMFAVVGESYGRGLGEHYLGDLCALESLARSIILSSAAAAHLLWLVNPNSVTKVSDLQNARTGAFVPGTPNDVQPLRLDKQADLSVAASTAERLETKLQRVFLLNTAAQRQAERVTAAEIRFVAQQLEDALGGSYSLMNEQLQIPLVARVMRDMERAGKLPEIPEGVVKPKIVTGLEGLGRNQELERLRIFTGAATENPALAEAFAQRVDPTAYFTRIAAAVGLDTDTLFKSPERLQQEAAQAQAQATAEQVSGPIAGAAAGPVADAVVDELRQQQ